jgi:hypothetical protein
MWKNSAFLLLFTCFTFSVEVKAQGISSESSNNDSLATIYFYRNSRAVYDYCTNMKLVCNGRKLCQLSNRRYLMQKVPAGVELTYILHDPRLFGIFSKKFVKTIKPEAGKSYYFLLDNQGIYGHKLIDVNPIIGEEEIKRSNPDRGNKKLISSTNKLKKINL